MIYPNLWYAIPPYIHLLFAILKGLTNSTNNRAIHRDPALYPDPDTFNPDRWLSPQYPTFREPLHQYPNMNNYSVFGFGRRLCPGAHIAERSLNIIVARVAWACTISKAVDLKTGRVLNPPEYDCKLQCGSFQGVCAVLTSIPVL